MKKIKELRVEKGKVVFYRFLTNLCIPSKCIKEVGVA